MTEASLDIPGAWENLEPARLSGTLMIIGPPDVGKSTFARYLFQRLRSTFPRVAFLDGDPGQSTLGPPATMSLAVTEKEESIFLTGRRWRFFVGALSPAGHMLSILTGAAHLAAAAHKAGAEVIIYDTSGLVGPSAGGNHLKLAKIDLLRPTVLFAIQRGQELESLLVPLRRSRRLKVIDLPMSPAVRRHDTLFRKRRRAANFSRYFTNASSIKVHWPRFAVLPKPHFERHQLVALEDVEGFIIRLGIVTQIDTRSREIVLLTPLNSLNRVDTIRLGNVAVDPDSFSNWHLPCGK